MLLGAAAIAQLGARGGSSGGTATCDGPARGNTHVDSTESTGRARSGGDARRRVQQRHPAATGGAAARPSTSAAAKIKVTLLTKATGGFWDAMIAGRQEV